MTRVTIADVALHAQVSRSAVSKVLRDAYGVSPSMRARVLAAIDELGYRPHVAARALRGHTSTLGVLLPDLRNPFFPDLVDGVAEEIAGTGYEVVISQGAAARRASRGPSTRSSTSRWAGSCWSPPLSPQSDLEAIAATVPVVVLGRHDRSPATTPSSTTTRWAPSSWSSTWLGLGHRRIAHIAHRDSSRGEPATLLQAIRARAYERAMVRLGLGEHADIAWTTYTEEGGHKGVGELLS
ncbi:LacI family DNA-binding transcriptional regulator [Nonomuraea ferruginea]